MTTLGAAAPPRPRDAGLGFGIYVHVPFCSHRCWYCDFNAFAGAEDGIATYMEALARDAADALSAPEPMVDRPTVTSIFVGGGTPSLVPAPSLTAVIQALRDAWDVATDAEITVECNPESADTDKLEAYERAGVNRVSFGVQSLDDTLLARLGRVHDARDALRALEAARRSGFADVNADLIFGIPGEDDDAWLRSLEGVLAAGVSHVSCYGLTYEEGTPMESWRRLGRIVPVPDDDVARRWEVADRVLGAAGVERYEISNWARPGRASRHNLGYWACGEYLGIGAGAHSHLAGEAGSRRSWTVKGHARYAADVLAGRRPVAGSEPVDQRARAAEVMFLGLRRRAGVDREHFAALTGMSLDEVYGIELAGAEARGLLEANSDGYRLTRRGTLLANDVVAAFLDPA